jgi:hypothetical protein
MPFTCRGASLPAAVWTVAATVFCPWMLTTAGRAACTARTTYVTRRDEISLAFEIRFAGPEIPIRKAVARHAQRARDGH